MLIDNESKVIIISVPTYYTKQDNYDFSLGSTKTARLLKYSDGANEKWNNATLDKNGKSISFNGYTVHFNIFSKEVHGNPQLIPGSIAGTNVAYSSDVAIKGGKAAPNVPAGTFYGQFALYNFSKGVSTTDAHEYGHLMGLPDSHKRGKNIMDNATDDRNSPTEEDVWKILNTNEAFSNQEDN